MKKIKKWLCAFLGTICIAAGGIFLLSCGGGGKEKPNSEVVNCTLTFVLPTGAGEIAPVTGVTGEAIPSITTPEWKGYYFDGWYLSQDFSGEPLSLPTLFPAESKTYYASYKQYGKLSFIVEGEEVKSVEEKAGESISIGFPEPSEIENALFVGWFTAPNGKGEQITLLPTQMPQESVTYYAYYRRFAVLSLHSNLQGGDLGDLQPIVADETGRVTIPEITYQKTEVLFLGWSETATGPLEFQPGKGLTVGYKAGDILTLDGDKTLYAQWAYAYLDGLGVSSDILYVSKNVSGYGSVILSQTGKENKLGFRGEDGNGQETFEFLFDESEGGDKTGRLFADGTYRYRDGLYGFYVGFDHVTDRAVGEILYADGYGLGLVVNGNGIASAYGYYSWEEEYQEYIFVEIDPQTGGSLLDENGQEKYFYFTVDTRAVEGVTPPSGVDTSAELKGYFLRCSDEAGSYYYYDNGSIGNRLLHLNGYGFARVYESSGEELSLIAEGSYQPSELYQDVFGEWEMTVSSGEVADFRFTLTYTQSDDGRVVTFYLAYQEEYAGELTAADGSGDTLTMDGYGGMAYSTAAGSFEGSFHYEEGAASPNLTLYVYEEGTRTATLYFDVNWETKTFAVNNNDFIVSAAGVLEGYRGNSKSIILPEEVNGIPVTAVADNVFKTVLDDNGNATFSVEEVVIPASVTSIGACAFQNNYTLRKVTFLGQTPPTVDFTVGSDPFRWPSGGFVIVVPEESKQAYVDAFLAAWTAAGRAEADIYRIKGSVEVTLTPEFEVDEKGALIAYNRPADADPTALVDLALTVGQREYGGEAIPITTIADEVFMGATWLRSIDLGNVTEIGASAFENCTALESVRFTNVEKIGDSAFYGCANLCIADGVLNLPVVVEIGTYAFGSCTSLDRVVAGEKLASIGARAFSEIKMDSVSDPFVLELTGATPPKMASGMVGLESNNVFYANSAYHIYVPNITYALACANVEGWSNYCGGIAISSGAESGLYFDGEAVFRIRDRAILDGTNVFLYKIDGRAITFYSYTRDVGYSSFVGIIDGDKISFSFDGVAYAFEKSQPNMTLTSTDGKHTLVVKDPERLDPDTWGGTSAATDILWDGVEAQLYMSGYKQKTVVGIVENGLAYNIEIQLLKNEAFSYKKKLVQTLLTAADGSTLAIGGSETYMYAEVSLKDFGYIENGVRKSIGDGFTYSASMRTVKPIGENAYAVHVQVLNAHYYFYVEVDGNTFTYSDALLCREVKLYTATTGEKVFVGVDGDTVTSMAIILPQTGLQSATFTAEGEGYFLTTAEASYTVLLKEDGSCTVASQSNS